MPLLNLFSEKIRDPAECLIQLGPGGEEIGELYPFLQSVQVQTARAGASTATLSFETRRDEHGVWAVQDHPLLRDWTEVRIDARFGSYEEEAFRGYIRQVKPEYPADRNATVTVECQDASLALDRAHRRRAWGNDAPTADGLIFNEILTAYPGLRPAAGNGNGLTGIEVNQDETDIAFLIKRAEINGYELIFACGEVYFGPWRVEADPQDTLKVYAGPDGNTLSLSVETDAHKPEVVAFEAAKEEGEGAEAEIIAGNLPLMGLEPAAGGGAGLDEFAWKMSREGGDLQELYAKAQAKANELSMRLKAAGEVDGSLYGHVLRVAEPVGVDGLGDTYDGVWYVDGVRHEFTADGYKQHVILLRNAYGNNLATGLGASIAGLF